MSAIEEKRMYGDRREETVVYVASGRGVAAVEVSGDRIGRFGLAHRCEARDVAVTDGRVYVATHEDVLAGGDEFEPLGFGEAVAVAADESVLAADEQGSVSRFADGEWTVLGCVDSVRALAGDFVAAADGLYRVDGASLAHVGLDDVNDVAAAGAPLAATADGLYRLGNGWLAEADGNFAVVAAGDAGAGHAGARDTSAGDVSAGDPDDAHAGREHAGRVHAATDETLYEYDGSDWTAVDLPVDDPVADVAYGECVYAVTRSGTFLVDADPGTTADGTGGWRSRSIGLSDVSALAVA